MTIYVFGDFYERHGGDTRIKVELTEEEVATVFEDSVWEASIAFKKFVALNGIGMSFSSKEEFYKALQNGEALSEEEEWTLGYGTSMVQAKSAFCDAE